MSEKFSNGTINPKQTNIDENSQDFTCPEVSVEAPRPEALCTYDGR